MKPETHRPRKRFGQNFLHDGSIVQQIIAAINPVESDHIVEIGPGFGVLTKELLPRVARVDAIELDRDIIPILAKNCTDLGNLHIHSADALNFDYCSLGSSDRPMRIIGNLPYNISTPLLFKLLEHMMCIRDMYFMLQKEVVERLTANTNSSNYGRLSVMTQCRCDMQNLIMVPPSAFNPPPKVDSAVISMRPYAIPPVHIEDMKVFSRVVTLAFAMRRKTLRNNFKGLIDDKQWSNLSLDPTRRAETLSIEEFSKISSSFDSVDQLARKNH